MIVARLMTFAAFLGLSILFPGHGILFCVSWIVADSLLKSVLTSDKAQFRHRKRGTRYRVQTHEATLCVSPAMWKTLADGAQVTVYRDVESGNVYVRETIEFLDGRFEKLS